MHSTNARAYPFHVLTHTDEPCLLIYRHKKCTTPPCKKEKLPRLLLYHPPTFPKRTAYYDSMLCSFETNEPTASPYMYTHNTYRTALYTTSNCTKHVKYRMPLFLLHERYYRVSLYLPHIVVPLTRAIPPRLVVSFTPTIPPHPVASFTQTNLRRTS